MAVGDVSAPRRPRTYGNWRKPATAGLLGLGAVGTWVMLGGLIVTVLVVMVAGLLRGLVVFVVLAALLGSVLRRDVHGRSLLDRMLARVTWSMAVRRGAHLYRSGPLGQALWGTHQLPGIAAQLQLSEAVDSYGRPFALIHSPSTHTYTAVIATEPDGASLVDDEQGDLWVANWGQWLANLGDEPGVEACAVTLETAPDSGHDLLQEIHANLDHCAPEFARQVMAAIAEIYPVGANTVRAYVTITFSGTNGVTRRRLTDEEMARDLAARLPKLTGSLSATGAGHARLVGAEELCGIIRTAYSPGQAEVIDRARVAGQPTGLRWSDVGPAAAQADWDRYRHDDAYSVTWAMSIAPRGHVDSRVLLQLLRPHRDLPRKRVTLLYQPIDSARAAAIVEADLRAAEFIATSSAKTKARAAFAVREAAATAAEEARGAGLVNFGMLVTATVFDQAQLPEARAAVYGLANTARLNLRPVYGAQSSAFAAALPLGLLLPKLVSLPAAVKERL